LRGGGRGKWRPRRWRRDWGRGGVKEEGGREFRDYGRGIKGREASNGNGDLLRSALLRLFTAAVACVVPLMGASYVPLTGGSR
jgi:hypothetical protein